MCIYCGTNKYRKIYENHYGPIPKDDDGRSYHIHHIDGVHSNNDPSNLLALSIQDHYDIHYSQGDLYACILLGKIIGIDPLILRELNKEQNNRRVLDGTHHLLSGDIQRKSSRKRASEGTLGFQREENLIKASIKRDEVVTRLVKEGNWILQDIEFHKKNVQDQIDKGRHCSQIKKTCEHCDLIVDVANYSRSHGDNCTAFTGMKKKIAKHPPREKKTCDGCGKTMDASNFGRHNHGPNCAR
jgi:hypothetical protein